MPLHDHIARPDSQETQEVRVGNNGEKVYHPYLTGKCYFYLN